MRKDVYINDVNYKHTLLKGELDNITIRTEDDDGHAEISSIKVKMSNMKNEFQSLINLTTKPTVKIYLDNTFVFSGVVSENGFDLDIDNKTVEFECLSLDKTMIEKLKSKNLRDLDFTSLETDFWTSGSVFNPIVKRFYPVKNTLIYIFNHFGILPFLPPQYPRYSFIPGDLYFGGATTSFLNPATPEQSLPDMSCYDYFTEIVKLFNGIWYIDASGLIYLNTKQAHLTIAQGIEPVNMKRLKGSATIKGAGIGYDKITFDYANSSDKNWRRILPGSYFNQITRHSQNILKSKEIKTKFKLPVVTGDRGNLRWSIPADYNSPDLLVRFPSGILFGFTPYVLTATEILENHYNVELRGEKSIEGTYSLMNDSSVLTALIKPFCSIHVPEFPNKNFFVREAMINASEETVKIVAVNYAIN